MYPPTNWSRTIHLCELYVTSGYLPHGTAVVPALDGVNDSSSISWVLSSVQELEDCLGIQAHGVVQVRCFGANLWQRPETVIKRLGMLPGYGSGSPRTSSNTETQICFTGEQAMLEDEAKAKKQIKNVGKKDRKREGKEGEKRRKRLKEGREKIRRKGERKNKRKKNKEMEERQKQRKNGKEKEKKQKVIWEEQGTKKKEIKKERREKQR
jgi:hypothetical protein